MSDNPYAPPSAELGGRAGSLIATGRGDFEIGRALSEAWASCWANFPLWLGVGIVWLVAATLATVTIVGILLLPVLSWGYTRFFLRMHDREAEFGDAFSGFSRFGQVFGPMLVLMILFVVLSFAAQSLQYVGVALDSDPLMVLGYLVGLAFQILAAPRITFAFFYLVDQGLPAIDALKRAWSETEPVKWRVVLLGLMVYPLMFAGLLALGVGVIPAVVIFYLMYVSAYRQMVGRPAPA